MDVHGEQGSRSTPAFDRPMEYSSRHEAYIDPWRTYRCQAKTSRSRLPGPPTHEMDEEQDACVGAPLPPPPSVLTVKGAAAGYWPPAHPRSMTAHLSQNRLRAPGDLNFAKGARVLPDEPKFAADQGSLGIGPWSHTSRMELSQIVTDLDSVMASLGSKGSRKHRENGDRFSNELFASFGVEAGARLPAFARVLEAKEEISRREK